MNIVTLTTDFGRRDWFVGVMKGVLMKRSTSQRPTVVDICHEVEQGNVRQANFVLSQSIPYFPNNAIHVCVVDPGVGSSRHPIVVQTDGPTFIGPDNGCLSYVCTNMRSVRVFEISNPEFIESKPSATFHGRDIFAPAAAALCNGANPIDFGSEIFQPYRLENEEPKCASDKISFSIQHIDTFGNIISNLPIQEYAMERLMAFNQLWINGQKIRELEVHQFYAAIPNQDIAWIPGSTGFWELAQKNGSAAEVFELSHNFDCDDTWQLRKRI